MEEHLSHAQGGVGSNPSVARMVDFFLVRCLYRNLDGRSNVCEGALGGDESFMAWVIRFFKIKYGDDI